MGKKIKKTHFPSNYFAKPSPSLFSLANTGFPVLRKPYDIY